MLDLFEKDFMVLLWKQNILIDWYVFLTLYRKIYLNTLYFYLHSLHMLYIKLT